MSEVTFQQAVLADLPEIKRLWISAGRRLAAKGIDQWQYPLNENSMMNAIRRGDCWLAIAEDGAVAGTVIIDDFADPEFWTDEDDPDSAVYVHRMIVDSRFSGQQIGRSMLALANRKAMARGREFVRLDAWRTNSELHEYYLGQGFALVRVVELPHRRSGALFQRRVDPAAAKLR